MYVQDSDTECFREGYDMLEGYDLVVQVCLPPLFWAPQLLLGLAPGLLFPLVFVGDEHASCM